MTDTELTPLLELAADLSGQSFLETQQLAAAMLPEQAPAPWCSTLNNDGSPLQLCISLAGGGRTNTQLLADPCVRSASSQAHRAALERAWRTLVQSRAPDMQALCASVLHHLLPASAVAGAWLAANLDGAGMAVYASSKWGNTALRWARTRQWLDHILPADNSESHPILAQLARHAALISAGVEGLSAHRARAKLYWRLNPGAALSDLALPMLTQPEPGEFLQLAVAECRTVRTAIVGSVSFEVESGCISDVKLDVCGHCVMRPWTDWIAILQRCTDRFGTAPWPGSTAQLRQKSELAFIGFGLDRANQPRLNVYMKHRSNRAAA